MISSSTARSPRSSASTSSRPATRPRNSCSRSPRSASASACGRSARSCSAMLGDKLGPQIYLPRHHHPDGHRHRGGRPACPPMPRSASPRRSSWFCLRMLQGLALGGEYGGAAIYVAEHAPRNKRGFYTSFIQAGVIGGFLLVGRRWSWPRASSSTRRAGKPGAGGFPSSSRSCCSPSRSGCGSSSRKARSSRR